MIATTLFDPDQRIGGQPVMSMHNVEMPDKVLCLEKMLDKRAAHVLDFVHEVPAHVEGAVVIPDPVLLTDAASTVACPGEDVDFMPSPFKRSRQLCNMRRHAALGNGVERFP